MTEIVPTRLITPSDPGIAGMHLTRSESGHVLSPWFTFDCNGPLYELDCKFHAIRAAAVAAFCAALNIRELDVGVIERRLPDGETQWCIHSRFPQPLPQPAVTRINLSSSMPGAIDV
jgi:hypothetical protein